MVAVLSEERFAGLNPDLMDKINEILTLYDMFDEITDEKFKSFIRFNDYYDINISVMENIEYFQQFNSDEKVLKHYIKYIVDKLLGDLFCVLNNYEFGVEDLIEILDSENVFDESISAMNYALDLHNKDDNNELKFLNKSNKYKIMFTKMASEDIQYLPKSILISLIKKLYSPFSTETVIKLSENIDHTNSLYKTHYSRIQFADDYRIAYFREKNVTVILGVTIKSGKDLDYSRYDACAKKNSDILKEVDDFLKGVYTKEHIDAVELLKQMYNKKMKNREK